MIVIAALCSDKDLGSWIEIFAVINLRGVSSNIYCQCYKVLRQLRIITITLGNAYNLLTGIINW